MRPYKYLFPVLAAALVCGCARPVRKSPPPPPQAAPVKKAAAAKPPAAEDVKKAESLYYKAVGAYSNNDMGAALKLLEEISAVYPSYPPAAELREKIRRVSGGK